MVAIKGKTNVKGGRIRGHALDGSPIRWGTSEQTVEVSEEQAAIILADPHLMVVRADAPAPPGEPSAEEARLASELAAALAELAALKAAKAAPAALKAAKPAPAAIPAAAKPEG